MKYFKSEKYQFPEE